MHFKKIQNISSLLQYVSYIEKVLKVDPPHCLVISSKQDSQAGFICCRSPKTQPRLSELTLLIEHLLIKPSWLSPKQVKYLSFALIHKTYPENL